MSSGTETVKQRPRFAGEQIGALIPGADVAASLEIRVSTRHESEDLFEQRFVARNRQRPRVIGEAVLLLGLAEQPLKNRVV